MTTKETTAQRASPGGETTSHHDQSSLADGVAEDGADAKPRVEPQLPHERDESSSSQASASASHAPLGKQALADTVGPGVDTDRGPVVDELYNDSVAERDADEPPRQ